MSISCVGSRKSTTTSGVAGVYNAFVKVTNFTCKGYKFYASICCTGSAVRSGSPLSDADADACNRHTFVLVLSWFCYGSVMLLLYCRNCRFCLQPDCALIASPAALRMHPRCSGACDRQVQRPCNLHWQQRWSPLACVVNLMREPCVYALKQRKNNATSRCFIDREQRCNYGTCRC